VDRRYARIALIPTTGLLLLTGCALLRSPDTPPDLPSQRPSHLRSTSNSARERSLSPRRPSQLTEETIAALPSPMNGYEASFDDPVLAEAQVLLQKAKDQVEKGLIHETADLLQRIHSLLAADGVDETPESRHRRNQLLDEVASLLDELAAIRAMSAIPAEPEAPLVSPEDVTVLERATPALPPTKQPEITSDIPIEINAEVQAYIELFTTKKREQIAEALERSGRYLPLMRQIFIEKALPEDLVNLAYIESAFKLYAYSRARAVGIWQFMKGTAHKYGLKVDWWVDERRDPVKATAAAADYLADLYAMFQSWPLAIAAYNAGEGKVLRAIQRQRTKDFWKLKLPRETKFYVPAFMAMTIIAKNPEEHGFTRPAEQPWQVDQVHISRPMDLRLLATAAGTSPDELRDWNPELNRRVTPPHEAYVLNLPPGTKETFLAGLEHLPETRRLSWRQHQVRSGETLSTIAQRYRTTVHVLMGMNELADPHRIRAGTRITVPVPALTVADGAVTRSEDGAAGSKYRLYVVKAGDNLWDIARAHRVRPQDLERWNSLESSLIHPGRTLVIYQD
jgi:membrane-bound lytic murein transglycosylase D